MSNTPGISPLTPDLEEIRHSDDPAFDDTNGPDDNAVEEIEGEDDLLDDEDVIERKSADLE